MVETHIYPKKPFEESKGGPLPQWRCVPGFNILLSHIYRCEPRQKSNSVQDDRSAEVKTQWMGWKKRKDG